MGDGLANDSFGPRLASKKSGVSTRMSIKRVPKWVWWVAVALIALQMYFFQELVAAYLIFGVLFGSFLILLLAVYLMSEIGDRGLGWMEANGRVAAKMAWQQWVRVEAISKKTFRRLRSESAQ